MDRLTFDADRHEYTYGGVKIPSVTELIAPCAYLIDKSRPWLAAEAAERGTAVHEATMLYDYGEPVTVPEKYAGHLKAYEQFIKDYNPSWELIEHMGCAVNPLVNGFLMPKYAGTLDRYGTIDGEPCIVDIKTGAVHMASITAQLTAYSFIAPEASALFGLYLHPDGTYDFKRIDYDYDLLTSCAVIWKATHKRSKA